MKAREIVEGEVRELVKQQKVDTVREDAGEISRLVDRVIDDYDRRMQTTDLPVIDDAESLRKEVIDRIAGFGALQSLFDDPEVEEVWVNGPGRVFCARAGRHELTNVFVTEQEIPQLVERMLRASGRRIDLSAPFVDATLADGSRLHVVIPDITRSHWAVNVRRFVLRAHRLDELVRMGSLEDVPAGFLKISVEAGLNIVVSGGTQSGKTTMLNCLAAAIPASQRVITCEEVFELQVRLPDVVALQTRRQNLEGRGAIDLRALIVEALRMRPDRLIVGEVRQSEALDLLVALNSGLPGMTSIHANNAREALTKLSTLPLLAGENVTHPFVVPTIASCIDLLVHLSNSRGFRRVEEIVGVTGRVEGDRIETVSLFERQNGNMSWTGHQPPAAELFAKAGIDPREMLR